jgi:hypothetical protein
MLKSLIACLVAAFGLAGCVAVPYYEPSGYYYGPPAPSVSFGYTYHGGGGHGHRHHRRHHRH